LPLIHAFAKKINKFHKGRSMLRDQCSKFSKFSQIVTNSWRCFAYVDTDISIFYEPVSLPFFFLTATAAAAGHSLSSNMI
jgi:hypothetical protein